jgi:hypothetical protein
VVSANRDRSIIFWIKHTQSSSASIIDNSLYITDIIWSILGPGLGLLEHALELGDEAELVSFELARDNTRLLLLVQTATGVRVLLTAVERNEDCLPQSLGDFVDLGSLTGSAVDAAWVDDSSVAVVVDDAQTGAGEVIVFDTNGRSTSLGRPTRPATLVGTIGGVPGLRLLSDDGLIYQPRGNGWQGTGERASVLATQR